MVLTGCYTPLLGFSRGLQGTAPAAGPRQGIADVPREARFGIEFQHASGHQHAALLPFAHLAARQIIIKT